MTKRILAILLTLAMVLSLCSVNVFADNAPPADYVEIFSWKPARADSVEPTWTGADKILNEANLSKLLEALNTEGAYLELIGKNACNQHGAMVNVGINGKDLKGYGYPTGEFARGGLVTDILGGTDKVESLFLQFGIWNHENDHTDDDFEEKNHVYLNGIKVYAPVVEEEPTEPSEPTEPAEKKEGRTFGYAIQLTKHLHGFLVGGKMIPMNHGSNGFTCPQCGQKLSDSSWVYTRPSGKTNLD